MAQEQKDYSSISPSARSLLLMKGYTDIPYAKQIADLMQGPEIFELDFNNKDFWFWIRVMHFESRYKSIDQLLRQTDNKNILELSSGYSFRGLDLCSRDGSLHYIDTDLPEVVGLKLAMIAELHLDKEVKGKFELLPLNAMDDAAFNNVVKHFDKGPLTIVNEGLLMYLNTEEKKRLCRSVYNALKPGGGCWITADIYIKRSSQMMAAASHSKGELAFFEQHHIEENKFESFEAAEKFFKEQGLELVKEAIINYNEMTALPHLLKVMPEEMRNSKKEPPPKIQATWMLKAI
jgi:O-methyltransferase involved in polyketide biosynthesis